eukprot:1920519-Rhodomonas_salina.3
MAYGAPRPDARPLSVQLLRTAHHSLQKVLRRYALANSFCKRSSCCGLIRLEMRFKAGCSPRRLVSSRVFLASLVCALLMPVCFCLLSPQGFRVRMRAGATCCARCAGERFLLGVCCRPSTTPKPRSAGEATSTTMKIWRGVSAGNGGAMACWFAAASCHTHARADLITHINTHTYKKNLKKTDSRDTLGQVVFRVRAAHHPRRIVPTILPNLARIHAITAHSGTVTKRVC